MGTFAVHALCDGVGTFFEPLSSAFPGAGVTDLASAVEFDPVAFPSDGGWRLHFHAFLICPREGGAILVDAGIGDANAPAADWAPAPGRMPENLTSSGVAPSDVDTVLLTHLHSDHVGWSVVDGRPFFPNARYVVPRADHDAVEKLNPRVRDEILAPLAATGQLDLIEGKVRLGPGVTTVPTPGHTPGHTSAVLESGDDAVVFSGDVVLNALQLVAPQVAYSLDDDPEAARAARLALLDEARSRGAWLATSHLTDPFVRSRIL
ncbi:MBL fold metallo-hydrolase [Actinoplanes sp. NEAU-A12]|uniref:MBL fold metallo-hydrolase n=1 Tax=Actinoplanes sandaracinus TaxID=3045177 RepID=A0ABT6WW74_9ACTN|nr:MBL fold metallo-hydrolase [Actinoplanes sandaracinus]MDI6103998.1 MBL fold metallo-hydrolase [Actinoplanes sandaracinus]